MRILGGRLGGRIVKPPMKKWPTRPTTDIAKEALFNILANQIHFEEVSVLDLFGGTGMISLEFVSRGCDDVTYVDRYHKCVRWVEQQAVFFDIDDDFKIVKQNVKSFITSSERKYDIIFADPPYDLVWITELPNMCLDMLESEGVLIIEHGADTSYLNHERLDRTREYGQTRFSFFRM